MKSNSHQHSFSVAPSVSAPRSSFNRNSTYKSAFDAGYLIPFYIDDVLPGDTFNLSVDGFARMATPLKPLMDNMYMDTHFFFVPYRLVWDNARKFFGEQANPSDSIDFQLPVLQDFSVTSESLSDYMGLPLTPLGYQSSNIVSLYHRGYNLIWNEWFRDQNLQNSVSVITGDGPESINSYNLLRRGKRHDYFTSCLPSPQKGSAVNLPLGTNVRINTDATDSTDLAIYSTVNNQYRVLDTTGPRLHVDINNGTQANRIYADMTEGSLATINDLREAFQVQKLLEKDARGGTRYSELVRNHFGVDFYDVSYRPEFLGGGSTPINTTPVPAQNQSADVNLGDLAGFTTAGFSNHGFTKSFVEHGFVMGFVSVRADLTYQQGIPRNFTKSTRYDIYWPTLAHLGEQAVLRKEIQHSGDIDDDDVFGYIPRYDEYRYKNSAITGKLRSAATNSLDVWHLSQDFALATLGPSFIEENPPIDRVVATPNEPHFIFDSRINLRCARPMPVHGVPGMIDHF